MNKYMSFFGRKSLRRFRAYANAFVIAVFCCVFAGNSFSESLNISFSAADKTVYYDDAASSLTWDDVRSYLYLPYGTQENIFSTNYPTMAPTGPPAPKVNKPQMGCTLVVQEDCYVSGFARWAGPNGGNPFVRLWTDDLEEYAGGINSSWNQTMGVGITSGWVERLIDFSAELYPLTAGNTYWLANVADDVAEHTVGDAGAATSGCSYVSVAEIGGQFQRWYILNDETSPGSADNPSENLEVIPAHLYGVPDMRLNRFPDAGSLVTKAIDLGATKVAINNFQVVFQTSNAKTGFDAVSKTDVMTYSIKYDMISALNRIPECEAAFSIAQSIDGDTFGDYETSFAGSINKRYIKIKMDLTTGHRGITPIVDSVSIAYNCYPEPIDGSSVSPANGDLVTSKSPVFSWDPSYDHDGDTVTYTLSLSAAPSFDTLIFSSGAVSVPASTYVAVNCPVELDDKTTYYFRIDAVDSNSALTGYDRTFSFKTELTPLYLVDSGIIDGSRVLASYAQNGFILQFSKDINFSTFAGAFTFIDASSAAVACGFSQPSSSSVKVVPADVIEPCKSYHFSVGLSLKDTVGLGIREVASVDFETLNSKSDAYTASVAGSSATISSGGSPEDFYVSPANLPISLTENTDLLAANNSANSTAFVIALSSQAFSYSITNAAGAKISSLTGLTLKLPYEPASLNVSLSASALRAGVRNASSDNIAVSPELLRVFRLNENSSQWGLVPGQQSVDTVLKTVTAYPSSGGTFSLLAYPSNPASYVRLRNTPNPFFRGFSTEIVYYLSEAANVTAKIYTQVGHLIYEKEYASGADGGQSSVNSIHWDGKNKDGAYVASGIYLLRLEISGEDTRTRKIGFIR